ncbi:hypothetical protein BC829DRAFT_413712 [Chytridium lagenaria]|nr:hypothetical protein BC829DRAFT_413712 [Chytridium lagenaria]
MSVDPATQKHKGFCFVEFDCPEAADLALATMNGSDLGGRNLKVGRPHNYNTSIGNSLPPPPETRVFVANVNENVTESMVRTIFESLGTSRLVYFWYIEFAVEGSSDSAIAAMQTGAFELGGLRLRAIRAIVGGPLPDGMDVLDKLGIGEAPRSILGIPASAALPVPTVHTRLSKSIPGHLQPGIIPGVNVNYASALQSAVQKVQAAVREESSSLEDNMSISASQRYSIMQKLLRKDEKPPMSPVVQLKNLVKVAEIDPDLEGEISEECSKYGKVANVVIWVDPNRGKAAEDEANIYVLFASVDEANRAIAGLNGRWFGGRKVEAFAYDLVAFNNLRQSLSAKNE